MSIARRLLASTTSGAAVGDDAAAAGRVYDALSGALAPVVGADGVRALLARSLRMSGREFPCLAELRLELPASEKNASIGAHIAACLHKHDAAHVAAAATTLYATFLALLARLVGDALTLQILRMAYPAIQVEETE